MDFAHSCIKRKKEKGMWLFWALHLSFSGVSGTIEIFYLRMGFSEVYAFNLCLTSRWWFWTMKWLNTIKTIIVSELTTTFKKAHQNGHLTSAD